VSILLELLDFKNVQDIYDFEIENRTYFEKYLPSRGDDYYVPERYNIIISKIIDEQSRGECFMYVIRSEVGKVIGRINFTAIQNKKARSAELGYRIGQAEAEKGIATKAVKMALELGAKEHGLEEIIAGTSADNIASQKVLEKNGFLFVEKIESYMEFNGKSIDSFNYVKFLQDASLDLSTNLLSSDFRAFFR